MSTRKKKGPAGKPPGRVIREKTPRSYRLSPAKLAAAREVLGASTATAAIEMALDMVIFRKELLDGTRAMHGQEIARYED